MSDIIPVEVPTVGESISEVQIGNWLKQEGDWVKNGEDLVEIETEKASVQIPAPASGYLQSITKQSDEFAEVGQQIASIQVAEQPADGHGGSSSGGSAPTASNAAPAPAAPAPAASSPAKGGGGFVMPAAQRLLDEHKLDASQVPATGPGGRLLKEDVLAYIRNGASRPAPAAPPTAPAAPAAPAQPMSSPETASLMTSGGYRSEEVKPMSMLRRTIASRLVQAQQTAALLTTFNEINMAPVMAIRSKYKDAFAKKHGVKLGFMSFFAKA
ncbi:biotin/lipoyl-containing protein, partial [Rhodopirellula bahusiensis]|uniref:biotin/lipoyl-containing protein n=1 Tax=Rhodopirellula bahusiensis TaxID=2014065 RepID=UPI003265C018